MRVIVTVLALPLLLLAGGAYELLQHPTGGMPTGTITIAVPPGAGGGGQRDAGVAAGPVVPVPTAAVAPAGAAGDTERLATLVAAAKDWLGTPYQWGGCTHRGVDCSCFTQHVYAVIGITVPRTTVTQVAAYLPVPRSQLRVGDSLFFNDTCTNCGPNPTHVGMYLGGGMMIDAGDPVRIEPVYWSKFAEAGRPAGL